MYVIDYLRSPQVYSGQYFKDISAPHLGSHLVRALLGRLPVENISIDAVVVGNVSGVHDASNLARAIALECGLIKTPGITLNCNCSSGFAAIDYAHKMIRQGDADLVLVGGVELLGRIPLTLSQNLSSALGHLMRKKWSYRQKGIAQLFKLKLKDLLLQHPLRNGLTDPWCRMSLGEMADLLAVQFNISREAQDHYAWQSHQKVNEEMHRKQIQPLWIGDQLIEEDLCVKKARTESEYSKQSAYNSLNGLQNTITSWNSAPLTDGAAFMILASEKAIERYRLKARAKIVDQKLIATKPERMGVAPYEAMDQLLRKNALSPNQIDSYEINEAFAAQLLSLSKMIEGGWGAHILDRVNIWGGGIALGHPFGATGIRLTGNLMHQLEEGNGRFGVGAISVAQGMGHSILIEKV